MIDVVTIGVTTAIATPLREALSQDFPSVKEWQDGRYTLFQCGSDDHSQALSKGFIRTLADLISHHLQTDWANRIIQTEYTYFDPDERGQILQLTEEIFAGKHDYFLEAFHQLHEFFENSSGLNVDGFVRFRLPKLWSCLKDSVDAAVDEYLMEREYKEFIKLLRYFVELQEPKIELANVIFDKAGYFHLLDDHGQGVQTDYIDGILLELNESDLDLEDLLISALITVAPQRIILHCGDESVRQTLQSIFEDRVLLCDGCHICYSPDKESKGTYGKGRP